MTASGNLLGIPVMAGLVVGMLLRDRFQARSKIPREQAGASLRSSAANG
jgi:hypothetical protein